MVKMQIPGSHHLSLCFSGSRAGYALDEQTPPSCHRSSFMRPTHSEARYTETLESGAEKGLFQGSAKKNEHGFQGRFFFFFFGIGKIWREACKTVTFF